MALIVVFAHLFQIWLLYPSILERNGAGWLIWAFKWTPLDPMMDGIQAVYVFFAISGLAVTYPILRTVTPHRTLAAMALYRYPRLTVPILASCLMAYLLLVTGAFANEAAAAHEPGLNAFAHLYDFEPDFMDVLKFSLWGAYQLPQVTRSWNSVLWTMPYELGGSFMLFLLLAVVRWRWLRLTIAIGLAAYWSAAFTYGYFYGFFLGYCLAELIVAAERSEQLRQRVAAATPLGWMCLATALGCSIWLQNASFGDSRLYYMFPMNFIGTLTIVGVVLTGPARAWLANPLSLFLGRISFGLYLTHLLIICSLSSALFIVTKDAMPYWLVVAIVGGLSIVVALGTAYLFAVLIEERLLRWLKQRIVSVAHSSIDAMFSVVRRSLLRIFA